MAFTYILYSETLESYYIGATKLTVEERLTYHLSNHRGYTSKVKDWIIVHSEEFECYKEALSQERKIKKRGARRYLAGWGR